MGTLAAGVVMDTDDTIRALIVETHPIDYQRRVGVYIPAQYKDGTAAPFMVVHDGPGHAGGERLDEKRLHDVVHRDEVARLAAVLVDDRPAAGEVSPER